MSIREQKWHNRYLQLAKDVATWSKDPSHKIGAIAVGSKGQVLSQGFNGFPRGINDTDERYNDRETKYKYVIHAEMNCIYNATYNGVSLDGGSLYVWGLPVCSECAKGIIQTGVKNVYWSVDEEIPERWVESYKFTKDVLTEAGVEISYLPNGEQSGNYKNKFFTSN
jgi:dCMP deaminase